MFKLLLFIVLIFSLPAIIACRPTGYIYNEEGAVECGADGEPIILVNNPQAANPTFDELIAFIQSDPTDARPYTDDVYVCADFAEEVHNNAEAAGIRAGWVGITFRGAEIGHAVNAFETVDRGTVFIDCTGSSDPSSSRSRDMVAYIKAGEKYGVISLERVLGSGFEHFSLRYDYYQQEAETWQEYKTLLEQYNEEVIRYNAEISGKVFTIGSPEEKRISAWERDLVKRGKLLEDMEIATGGYWYESEYSSYTVSGIQVHWQ